MLEYKVENEVAYIEMNDGKMNAFPTICWKWLKVLLKMQMRIMKLK